jgi:hydrogenase maturation protease
LEKLFQILVYGYGNPGRQDDGLGSELVRRLELWREAEGIDGLDFDENYQLNIEDAEIVSRYKLVIFADASTEDIGDFLLTDVDGEKDVAFTTHAASPGYIVQLCHDLFNAFPVVKLLHIKGYEWEFDESLSEKAEKNLDKALAFIKKLILNFLNTTG